MVKEGLSDQDDIGQRVKLIVNEIYHCPLREEGRGRTVLLLDDLFWRNRDQDQLLS